MSKLEPVAEVGSTYTLLWAGSETISAIHERSGVKVGSLLVTTQQAEAYAAAKVREALEEAARICDDRANKNELAISEDEPDEASSLRSAAWQMSVCARAIRTLIPRQTEEEG